MQATIEPPVGLDINPEVARLARERLGLTVDDAVTLLNKRLQRERASPISSADVENWESGHQRPDDLCADALARVYLVPFVALFQKRPQTRQIVDFRLGAAGATAPLSYDSFEELSRFDRLYLAARRIAVATGTAEDISVPHVPLTDLPRPSDVDNLANDIRRNLNVTLATHESWNSDDDALESWQSRIEDTGTFIFRLPLSPFECRAASKWEPGGPPAILLSSIDSKPGQLFSLLHEFAHLTFKKTDRTAVCYPPHLGSEHEERWANRFAGSILVPRDLVNYTVPPGMPTLNYSLWPQSARSQMRNMFRVSHPVIGIRLQQLGKVKKSGYRPRPFKTSAFVRGHNRPIWQRYHRFLGSRTVSLARSAVRSESVTPTELALLLDIKVADAEALLA